MYAVRPWSMQHRRAERGGGHFIEEGNQAPLCKASPPRNGGGLSELLA